MSEFKASLVYKVRSRTARTIQRNPVWKNQKKKKKKRKKERKKKGKERKKERKKEKKERNSNFVKCESLFCIHVCVPPGVWCYNQSARNEFGYSGTKVIVLSLCVGARN